ncbi:MAG: hypothetical protein PVF94_06735 [Desulfobacterales bacterium]|jgi:hypothetical protein
MGNRLGDLFLSFQKKGFMSIEIPGLMQDLFNIIGKGRYCTITDANQELEDLGWGFEIMDNVTYQLINSLFNKKWQTSLS